MIHLVRVLAAHITLARLRLWRALNPARTRWMPVTVWRWLQPSLGSIVAMARYSPTGKSEVHWVTTIANINTPTTAELNAGQDLTAFCRVLPTTPRGLNTVDISNLSSKTNFNQVGSRGGDTLQVEVFRDDATDTAISTLAEDTAGYLVLARKGLATRGTFAVADEVDVYPATVGAVEDQSAGRDDADVSNIFIVQTDEANRGYSLAT